jgi:hypothetical protein
MITTCMMETGYLLHNGQTDNEALGDIAGEG